MADIGAAKGISQPTVSRRIARALEDLREILRGKGVTLAAGTLGGFLMSAAEAAPAPVLQALGKMLLTHTASGSAGVATAASPAMAGSQLAAIVAAGALLVGAGWWTLRPRPTPVSPATNQPPAALTFGFSTSVVWSTGPGGRVMRTATGTNYAVTNFGPTTAGPATGTR
jgi:hypothetical protein